MKTNLIIDPVDGHELADVLLAKNCIDVLCRHYPDHIWSVHMSDEPNGGFVVIRNLNISFDYGYFLKITRLYNDPGLKCVVMAAGEILERACMRRGVFREEML